MNGATTSPSPRPARRTFLQRLRPFVHRDLRARLVSAAVAVALLAGLSWLGVSALTRMDTAGAHALRIELGLEHPHALCSGPGQPACTYDDREQARADERFALEQRIRGAIVQELGLRVAALQERTDKAQALLREREIAFENGLQYGGDRELWELLSAPVDLRPLVTPEDELVALSRLEGAAYFDGLVDRGREDTRDRLLRAIETRRAELSQYESRLVRLERRESVELPHRTAGREELMGAVRAGPAVDLTDWALRSGNDHTSATLVSLLSEEASAVRDAVTDPAASLWQGGLSIPSREYVAIVPPSVRYASPVEDGQRMQLLGTLLIGLASVLLLVLGPVVTATTTAREREAGTLPVLRMTGLSAGDLALAMVVGPNVFALATGGALLALGSLLVLVTSGPFVLALPLALLAVFAAATHLSAIGLGDALGQRVNALVVGALLALAIVGPGLVGSVMTVFDVAATGLLLGPLPAVMESVSRLGGLPDAGLQVAGAQLGTTVLAYAIFGQALLGLICLHTWRRRVEQAWAPLFRPREGITLALVSIGCSALSLLDLSQRSNAQDFDVLNLVTFVSTVFLLPVLGWLLVASLRRPARASAVASTGEARWAFARFQGLILAATAVVGAAYWLVMRDSGLLGEDSEVMWATLTQILLVAETAVGTLLLTSRRRDGKARVAVLGGLVVLLQVALTIGVYGLEVEHVAKTNSAASPLLVGMEVSSYWIVFLVLLWAAGLAIIGAALLRERRPTDVDEHRLADHVEDEEEGDALPGGRLLH